MESNYSQTGWYVHPSRLKQYRCASLTELEALLAHEYGDDAAEQAAKIRAIWYARTVAELDAIDPEIVNAYMRQRACPSARLDEVKHWQIDRIARMHGVEYLGRTPGGADVSYCNAGDTYAETIVFVGSKLKVTDWGTLIETGAVRGWDRFTGHYACA